MLQVIGLTLAGGLLLLFVCWKMYRQIVTVTNISIEDVEAGLANTATTGNEVPILVSAVDDHSRRPVDVARQRIGGSRCCR